MGFYEKGKWWVSPANYEEEATSRLHFPKKVEFLETTLRDGEQQPGIILTKEEKVEIAKRLDKLGVTRIEAGTPAALKEDAEAIKEISSLGLKADIYAFVRNMPADMQLAKECGVNGVIAETLGSKHMLEGGKRWTFEKAVKTCQEATLVAKDLGMKVTFFPADSSRADMDWLIEFVHQIRDGGHMDALTLVDTFGVFSPDGAYNRVTKLKKAFPDLPIEIHAHDDFGMGTATTIAALSAGAEVAHVTVNGTGERIGNTPIEPLVMSLEALYGVDTGIDTTQFMELSRFCAERCGFEVPFNRAIVGDKIFRWETGLPSSLWMNAKENDPLIMLPYSWTMTGNTEPELLLGKKSGKDNVKVWLQKTGLSVEEDKLGDLLQACKNKSYALKRLLTEDEFKEIVKAL